LGMGTNSKGCFLGGMGGWSLVVFQSREVEFFLFFEELFFWWCGMGCLEKVDFILFYFWSFFSFMIWWLNEDFFSNFFYIKSISFFGEWKIFI
jgi:hypothetical protein